MRHVCLSLVRHAQCGTVERIGRFSSDSIGILWNVEVPFRHDLPPPNHLGRPPPLRGSHPPMCDIMWHLASVASTIQHCLDMFGPGLRSRSRPRLSVKLLLSRWCSIHLDSAWWFAERSRSILGPSCPLFIFVPEVAQVVLVVVAVDSPRALSAAEVLLRPFVSPGLGRRWITISTMCSFEEARFQHSSDPSWELLLEVKWALA